MLPYCTSVTRTECALVLCRRMDVLDVMCVCSALGEAGRVPDGPLVRCCARACASVVHRPNSTTARNAAWLIHTSTSDVKRRTPDACRITITSGFSSFHCKRRSIRHPILSSTHTSYLDRQEWGYSAKINCLYFVRLRSQLHFNVPQLEAACGADVRFSA